MKQKLLSVDFNFVGAVVRWTEASPGSLYKWNIQVYLRGSSAGAWNAQMSPTKTGAMFYIKKAEAKTK